MAHNSHTVGLQTLLQFYVLSRRYASVPDVLLAPSKVMIYPHALSKYVSYLVSIKHLNLIELDRKADQDHAVWRDCQYCFFEGLFLSNKQQPPF